MAAMLALMCRVLAFALLWEVAEADLFTKLTIGVFTIKCN